MRVLSIDGGGYLGLATAAFIAGTERHFGMRFSQHFDLFCGTSTGAILALALATGKTGAELVTLYKDLGSKVFGNWGSVRNQWRRAKTVFGAKYGNENLRQALKDAFGDQTFGDLLNQGRKALITTFCTTTGSPRVFKTDHSPRLSLHKMVPLRDAALASSSAPLYFPLARLTNPLNNVTENFCDGGVVSNAPALLGFTEAISDLGAAPSDVKLLSLSTPRVDLSEGHRERSSVNRGAWRWKDSLATILIDANSALSHQVLKRIVTSYGPNGPVYVRQEMVNKAQLPMDRADEYATNLLIRQGETEASLNDVRDQLIPFFRGQL